MNVMKFAPEHAVADPLMVPQALCRLMLQASLLAIPVYLGLFMIAVPYDVDAGRLKGMALSAPVAIFLMAAIAYAIGFLTTLPDRQNDSRDIFVSGRHQIRRFKLKLIAIGSGFFAVGIASGTLLLIKAHL